MTKSILSLFLVAVCMAFVACGGNATQEEDATGAEQTEMNADQTDADKQMTSEEKVDKTGPEYTSAYVCPMHCEGSGSDEPGVCPVCGMDYVANVDSAKEDHDHDHNGHDHEH